MGILNTESLSFGKNWISFKTRKVGFVVKTLVWVLIKSLEHSSVTWLENSKCPTLSDKQDTVSSCGTISFAIGA